MRSPSWLGCANSLWLRRPRKMRRIASARGARRRLSPRQLLNLSSSISARPAAQVSAAATDLADSALHRDCAVLDSSVNRSLTLNLLLSPPVGVTDETSPPGVAHGPPFLLSAEAGWLRTPSPVHLLGRRASQYPGALLPRHSEDTEVGADTK